MRSYVLNGRPWPAYYSPAPSKHKGTVMVNTPFGPVAAEVSARTIGDLPYDPSLDPNSDENTGGSNPAPPATPDAPGSDGHSASWWYNLGKTIYGILQDLGADYWFLSYDPRNGGEIMRQLQGTNSAHWSNFMTQLYIDWLRSVAANTANPPGVIQDAKDLLDGKQGVTIWDPYYVDVASWKDTIFKPAHGGQFDPTYTGIANPDPPPPLPNDITPPPPPPPVPDGPASQARTPPAWLTDSSGSHSGWHWVPDVGRWIPDGPTTGSGGGGTAEAGMGALGWGIAAAILIGLFND